MTFETITLTYKSNMKIRMFIEKIIQLNNSCKSWKIKNMDFNNEYLIVTVETEK